MILVTGATGLIGSNLLLELVQTEKEIIALYRNKNNILKVEKLFKKIFKDSYLKLFQKISWKECDILDITTLNELIKNVSIVYHCAALVSFRKKEFNLLIKVNAYGTANVVNACLSVPNIKLCHVSSTSAVGKEFQDGVYFVTETNKWKSSADNSGYAISKYLAEKEVWRGIEEGLHAVIINPCVVFGPGSWNESSLSIFRTIYNGLKFYTSGSNAFVDVRDVAKSMIFLIKNNIKDERYLCIGENISFKEAFEKIAMQLNKKAASIYANVFLTELTWRMSTFISLFGVKMTITKETAKSSQSKVIYNSEKLKSIIDFQFHSLDDTISYTIKNRLDL